MDLSHPERSLGGRLDLPILTTLGQADRDWSTGEVARLIGASTVGVREALRRLADVGLVRHTSVGRIQGYRLNTDHVMSDVVSTLSSATAKLRGRIIDEVAGWEEPAVSVTAFGSWARGEAGPDSDIDLVLIHRHLADSSAESTWAGQLDHLDASIRAWSGNRCDLLSFSVDEWLDIVRRRDPIVEGIAPHDAALLYGSPLSHVASTAADQPRRRPS